MRMLSLISSLPLLLAAPAAAWDFTDDPVCTIWHDTGSAEMRVTYDPRQAEPYAITVTLADTSWPNAPVYAIQFRGMMSYAITTNRHRLSEDGRSVVASDTGFGNVLGGLANGLFATPMLGSQTVDVPLVGAAEAVAAFEACATVPGIS